MLAYTGLETVANLAEEAREPGRTLPRSLFSAIGLVVLHRRRRRRRAPPSRSRTGATALGDEWLKAPLAGIVDALAVTFPTSRRRAASSTSASPARSSCSRRRRRRCRASRASRTRSASTGSYRGLRPAQPAHPRLAAAIVAARRSRSLVIGTGLIADDVEFLASLYSFGVLLAFAAAQLAVIRLRFTEPDLPRPFRAPLLAPLLGVRSRSRSGSSRW